jgi:tRNA pseudouridine38-40 synthase
LDKDIKTAKLAQLNTQKKVFLRRLNMQRCFIELSYDGSPYHGWQTQPNASTVQECLDKALSTFYRQDIVTVGCGRTDTGVHAKQFYAHFDLQLPENTVLQNEVLQKQVTGINALLPYSIGIKRIFKVAEEAHARFDASSRTYEYHLHFHKDPFKTERSWLYKGSLDVEKMNAAAAVLLDYTDFSCFSKSNTQTFTNNCQLMVARFEVREDGLIFTIKADRFLRNMVRAIVGTLIRVGKDEVSNEELKKIIESKDRSNAGQSVPACGLYLVSIEYPYLS